MRVISFQSKEVFEIIINKGIYTSDINKCRENNNYEEDIKQLNANPIWIFNNPNICFNLLKNGEILERWRCEMSLDQEIGLTQFLMLELEIDECNIKIGKSHNSYNFASVVSKITKDQLCAVHHIENTNHFFYKRIVLDKMYKNSTITNSCLDTRELKFYGIYKKINLDKNKVNRCMYCEGNTSHLLDNNSNNVFVCSKYCKDKIIKLFKDNLPNLNYKNEYIVSILNKDIIINLRFGKYDEVRKILNKE